MTEFEIDNRPDRREFIRSGVAGAIALSAGGLLSACGSSSGSTSAKGGPALSNGPSTQGPPVRGGTLTIGLVTGGNAETLDVRKTYVIPDYTRSQSLYDPLFFPQPGGTVSSALAVEAHANTDSTVWTLKLRDGVVWHDGKPFTADDVVYTIKSSWPSASNFASTLVASLIDFRGVRKLDKLTVRIPLLTGLAQLPYITNLSNLYIVQEGTTRFPGAPGTGPFVYESFMPGVQSVFRANKNYWIEAQPYVDRLVVNSSFANDSARLNALLSGQVDVVPTIPQALAKVNASRLTLGNQPGSGAITVGMRLDKAPFTDPRAVKAMKLLVDRKAIVTDIYDDYATLGNDIFGNTYQYFASSLKRQSDPEQARSLIKASGLDKASLTLFTSETIPGQNELATLFAQQARAVGLNIQLRVVDPSIYYTPASPGGGAGEKVFSTDSFLGNIQSLPIIYLSLFGSQYFDSTHWPATPKANKILFEALAEKDAAKAQEKWLAVQEMQFNRGGYVLSANLNWVDGYAPKVRGLQTTSIGPCDNYTFRTGWLAS